jgi:hypothetical protein
MEDIFQEKKIIFILEPFDCLLTDHLVLIPSSQLLKLYSTFFLNDLEQFLQTLAENGATLVQPLNI